MNRLFASAAAAMVLVLLTGCGKPAEVEGSDTPPSSQAGTAGQGTSEHRLEYLRYATELGAAQPLLCLVFSAPLDPHTDYSAYLAIDTQVALAVDGQRLCIGGLAFGETRSVTLRAGLPSADGRRLAADISETLSFADRPAIVRFSGGGVILPRIDAQGVALETVNVDTLRVTVSRVNDRALALRSISAGYEAASGEWAAMPWDARPDDFARQLWQGEMDTAGPANAPVVTVFPLLEVLGELQPGAYVLRAENLRELEIDPSRQAARAERWLVITDLAFTAYRGSDGLDAVLRSLQTAQPVANARVQLLAASNEILAETRSDGGGRVRFAAALLRGQGPNAPRLLAAYGPDGDFAVLDLQRAPVELPDEATAGRERGAVDGYLYLDRGVYRPGERVHASALIRDAAGFALAERGATLALLGPSGLEQARMRFERAALAGGVFHEFMLPQRAARGQWRVTLSVDGVGEIARRSIGVEDFVPQRVELRLHADSDTALQAQETRAIEAEARFLYGAPGAGLEVQTRVRVQPDPQPFGAHRNFSFGVHDEAFRESLFELPAMRTDGAGKALLALAPETAEELSSLPLQLRTQVAVLEPGGRAVTSEVVLPYRPRGHYVGLATELEDGRAEIGAPVRYRVLAVDAAGEPLEQRLQWRLVRNDWTYDWYRTQEGEWRWRRSRRVVPIEDGEMVAAGADGGSITTPALDWGDYTLLIREDEQAVASAGFQVGWGGYREDGLEAPDRVRVTGPARAPRVGERAEITIIAPYAGLAEVAIATDRVLETRTLQVPEGGATLSVPVGRDWGAGAYVMVSVYTPRDAVQQPRPRRAVGVAHVAVDVAAEGRVFTLALDAPQRARPGQPLQIGLEATGLPARETAHVTLAAVDEGILLLTGFRSPDPVDWFFGRTRLGVDLLDDYGRLLDPNQGRAAAVRSGGDSIGGEGLAVVPTRTVALFSGPVTLDARGRGGVTLDLPDFNGELRLMAVAWSNSALAAASRPLSVRDAVPAEVVLPRFLAPGDTAQATLTLDNVEGAAGDYSSELRAQGGLDVPATPLTMTLRQGERADRRFALGAGAEGIAEVSLAVRGPDDFAVARSWPLQVRPAWLPASRITRSRLQPGERLLIPPEALAGYAPGSADLQVSFAATPIDAAALYRALGAEGHGGTEALVSRALPLLYAGRLQGLSATLPPADADAEIRASIETLLSRQDAGGAFGAWRIGDVGASPWLGAYVTDFLARAAQAGHSVPAASLARAHEALQPIAQGELWRSYGYDTRQPDPRYSSDTSARLAYRSAAYASYVLARAGRVDRSRLRYLHDEELSRIESPLARAHIGAALASIGDRARAINAFEAAVAALGYENPGDYLQSARRDLAGVLALAAEAGLDEHVAALAERAGRELPEPAALTTHELAFLLLAAQAIAGDADRLSIRDDAGREAAPAVTLSAAQLSAGLTYTNHGERPVWVTQFARGTLIEPPSAASEGLVIEKALFDHAGRPVDAAALQQGDQLVVVIALRSRRAALAPLLLTDLLPAGFEIEAVLGAEDAGERGRYGWLGELAALRVAEARDDRLVAALEVRSGQRYRLAYLVRAVTPGEFALPGVVAEDTSRRDVFARSATGKAVITP
jgi:uncharacterized protein YfaS (alpha-2-macroglobulin family)